MKVTFLDYSKYSKIWIWTLYLPSPVRSLNIGCCVQLLKTGNRPFVLRLCGHCLLRLQPTCCGGHILTTHPLQLLFRQASVRPPCRPGVKVLHSRISAFSLWAGCQLPSPVETSDPTDPRLWDSPPLQGGSFCKPIEVPGTMPSQS